MNHQFRIAFAIFMTLSFFSSGPIINAMAITSNSSNTVLPTATPIKHLVILYQENISFDHYFGTYPYAQNPPGEPKFTADPNTPSVNGLSSVLMKDNPNSANPFRLDRTQEITCDMNHGYKEEQQASHSGLMDKFVEFTGSKDKGCDPKQVMGYYDGNTVTALWNYAQHYAMSDNFFESTFGPTLMGHINFGSGLTHGAIPSNIKDKVVNRSIIANIDPTFDDCSNSTNNISMNGKNIGDLLNAKNVTWGWFAAGFSATDKASDGKVTCEGPHKQQHAPAGGETSRDYFSVVEPFQYYKSTSNPHHLPPTSTAMIGHTDQANHQYDMNDFWKATQSGNMPAVSFLKAPNYQSGHPTTSSPLDEQNYLVDTINRLQTIPQWNNTAIIVTWDDSDGWYDHVMPPIISQSDDPKHDALLGKDGLCGHPPKNAYKDRCGYGPRIPFIVISPYAKTNFVDHGIMDQTSMIQFIEDNWGLGRIGDQSFDAKAGSLINMLDFSNKGGHGEKLFLDPLTGLINSTAFNKQLSGGGLVD